MAEALCGGTIFSESEFLPNEIYFGKCGENMQAMLQSWATQRYRSTTDVYTAMRKANRCDLSGASTMSQQVAQAKADGFTVASLPTNTSMPESTWRAFLLSHLPQQAVGLEVANGQALKDELTGLGEDASNLRFHFFSVFGHHDGGYSPHAQKDLPAGWWCADGDSYVNNTRTSNGWNRHLGGHTLCFYSEATMRAAKPCAALALYPKVTIVGGVPVWTKVNPGLARDSQGHTCGGAMYQFLSAKGLLGVDALSSEVYRSVAGLCDAYLPLANGLILTATHANNAWTVRSDRGAQLMLALLAQQPSVPSAPAEQPSIGDQILDLIRQGVTA